MALAASVSPPSPLLALTEAPRAAGEVIALKLSARVLAKAPRGDGHPVMVLPGFLGADGYSSAFRRFLGQRNFVANGWGLGRNLGPREGVLEALHETIMRLSDRYRGPVSLVGHSLGGIYARELAREMPDRIRQVVSLGSPFGEGREAASYPARLFAAMNPDEDLPIDKSMLAVAPPVPTTAVYSHGDGIVHWKTAVQSEGHSQTQSIQVRGSHCGMTLNPTVWFLVSVLLSQAPGEWKPFEATGWANLFYPTTG
ncbi:MAG: alpha/beta fold hydrolase [Halieaceae bacterium]|nr:alpha/beta fold hydrolase [Halieaceae bacterium]